ncbi:MAG: hypothetical protein PVG93_05130 [Phycisphaerales bacterium]|jgi:hypothetical protein
MKKSPDQQKLEQVLRSSMLSAVGFLGDDNRSLTEIIEADLTELAKLNFTADQLAEKMQQITDLAAKALGNWAQIDDTHQAKVAEAKGRIPCPWPHPAYFAKRVTTLKDTETGDEIKWSDLNIHLIKEHSFFEGKGSPFRIEPKQLIRALF